MSRKKISLQLVVYVCYLFSLFLIASFANHALGFSIGYWFCFAGLFLLAIVPLIQWTYGLQRFSCALELTLNDLLKGNWELDLPSIGTQELWQMVSKLHDVRRFLHDKIVSLEAENEKIISIFSNLKEAIIVADPGNRIVLINEEAAQLLQGSMQDWLGKSLDTFLEGELKEIFKALIRGEERSEIISLYHHEKTFMFRSFLSRSVKGDLLAKVAVLYDITESKKLEEMRKAFVANASHELRSPAAGLQAIHEAFQLGGLEDLEQRKKFMGMMEREVGRLAAIIRDLLDLSELEREKEFTREPLPVVHLFKEWLQTYDLQIKDKGIQVITRFENQDIVLNAVQPDIEKLFRNLFENAVKYTPAGGSIEIGLKQEHGEIRGWVKDSGIGIPKQHQSRIFERFYRVDKSRSRALGGTGLGLAIAKHAVERHEGMIWVESGESTGTTFHFTFPVTSY